MDRNVCRTMSSRRRAALGLWVALTFSFAVLVHGVIHAAGSGGFVWDSPFHVVLGTVALVLLAAACARLGLAAPAAERRRRIALVRADLRPFSRGTVLFGAVAQLAIALLILLPEGVSLDPDRTVAAALAGLVALVLSALLLRAARDRVVALLVAVVANVAPAPAPRTARRRGAHCVAHAGIAFRLFAPNRAPPLSFAR